jgi:hypothetical protein
MAALPPLVAVEEGREGNDRDRSGHDHDRKPPGDRTPSGVSF